MGYNYTNPPVSPSGNGMLFRSPSVPFPEARSPIASSPRIPLGRAIGGLAAIVAIVEGIGALGASKFRDTQLAKLGYGFDASTGLSKPVSTGEKFTRIAPAFTGGQVVGAAYFVLVKATSEGGTNWYSWGVNQADSIPSTQIYGRPTISGAISGVSWQRQGALTIYSITGGAGQKIGNYFLHYTGAITSVSIESIVRVDGLEDVSLPSQNGDPLYEGYSGSSESAYAYGVGAAVGRELGGNPIIRLDAAEYARDGILEALKNRKIDPTVRPTPDRPPTGSNQKPYSIPKEIPTKSEDIKLTDSSSSNSDGITAKLDSIAATTALINARQLTMNSTLNDVKNQTSAENQRTNAKAGSCEAMNSPSCTQGFEGRIKDPINQNINDKTGALNTLLSGINTALSSFIAAATSNFDKILRVLNNQYVDRAMAVGNFALSLHNALMLSNQLGRTASGIVDNLINLTPLKFVDANGQATTASRVFGQNIEAFFINAIGLENYTELTEGWAVANRIIRSSTNLLNRTESLFAKSAKVGQKLGADIGDLANAMLVNGVISPSSYPKKAASKAANDALDSDTASDISSAASGVSSTLKNLKTITGEVLTVTRNAQKISTEFTKLTALFNADSKVRKDLRIQIATKAKKRSIYTIVDIKQIKINADKRPNSKPIR